jgi:hypothetical protein
MWLISLHQPYASFIGAKLKPFETRGYPPPANRIGLRIGIHATKRRMTLDEFKWALRLGVDDPPLGAIVCTAVLRGAYQMGTVRCVEGSPLEAVIQKDEFGDYQDGRWAWWLTDVEPVAELIPMQGRQGWWRCDHPALR